MSAELFGHQNGAGCRWAEGLSLEPPGRCILGESVCGLYRQNRRTRDKMRLKRDWKYWLIGFFLHPPPKKTNLSYFDLLPNGWSTSELYFQSYAGANVLFQPIAAILNMKMSVQQGDRDCRANKVRKGYKVRQDRLVQQVKKAKLVRKALKERLDRRNHPEAYSYGQVSQTLDSHLRERHEEMPCDCSTYDWFMC